MQAAGVSPGCSRKVEQNVCTACGKPESAWKECLGDSIPILVPFETNGGFAKLFFLKDGSVPPKVVRIKELSRNGVGKDVSAQVKREREKRKGMFMREVVIAQRMSDLEVAPKLHTWYISETDGVGVMVMDYYPQTLRKYLEEKGTMTTTMSELLMNRIWSLAETKYMCVDLKLDNIVVDPGTKDIRLIDFGEEMCDTFKAETAQEVHQHYEAMLALARAYAWAEVKIDLFPQLKKFKHDVSAILSDHHAAPQLLLDYTKTERPMDLIEFLNKSTEGQPWRPQLFVASAQ